MSKLVWERKQLMPDEANEYDVERKMGEMVDEWGRLAQAAENEINLIDGCNKNYVVTIKIEELDG